MDNILYCFISHESVINQDIISITNNCKQKNIKDYFIIYGNGRNTYNSVDHTLHLDSDDTYEGLPNKIYNLFKFIVDNKIQFNYYAKLDRLTYIVNPITENLLIGDYCGSWVKVKDGYDGNRKWHFNKCSKNSHWNNKPYPGEFIPWCRGPGYFLSKNAIKIISCNPPDPNYHIYEDLYVSQTLLRKAHISPNHITNLTNFIVDPESEL